MKQKQWITLLGMVAVALILAACDGDSGNNSSESEGDSSSSVEISSSGGQINSSSVVKSSSSSVGASSTSLIVSSSSAKSQSSSSVPLSSSVVKSSSSSVKVSSSSVVVLSSSAKVESSSSIPLSSSVGVESSSSPGTISDARDGQTYKTVTIGTQTWMAENLNYAVNGSLCYDNAASNCTLYGRLYTWATVMGVASTYNSAILGDSVNYQGICPDGWHVPRSSEWDTLENYVGGASTVGRALKSTSGWLNGGNGTDAYGFSALPGGSYSGSDFSSVGYHGYWWTATECSSTNAYYRYMNYYSTLVYTLSGYKTYGRSLRCLKD